MTATPSPALAGGPGGSGTVAVVATTAEVLAHPAGEAGLLTPGEQARLARIRLPHRRDDVTAARLLLRLCAAHVTARPAHELSPSQHCPTCGRDGHGRPYLPDHPDLGVSLSHADGLVAAAVGPGPVGIDVEPSTRRPAPLRMLARVLPAADLRAATAHPDPGPALLRLWVRREARLKAGRDDLPLLEWTDPHRTATTATTGPSPTRTALATLTALPARDCPPHTPSPGHA
ncbi:4'-phosphopantetheinyl transferase superfamily protein [Streptomyces chumphonensis]|uniref:4'-phosphopantetheinyl transferase superfamily protein n=3 Tax=Streptomyces chumphonensis TaxID=1214925 RepID=A0A927F4L4_9ACTN|nr:4'-phosphopantetheinyl transferase superfamily protein [Streptomyces chumphonensis]MBD3934910.1 4'-phosphopantetheinyl transferase superfamily protein [Streptomyces chumphonensis]